MAGEDLPVYGDSAHSGLVVSPTERPATTLHVFTYDVPSSKDSCLLKFASRAVTPLAAPVFFEGDVITGTVELKLAKKGTFKGVDIRFRGFTQVTAFAGLQFDMLQTTGVNDAFIEVIIPAYGGGKLESGAHSWPFSLTIPKTFVDSVSGTTFDLPPRFIQKPFPTSIAYDLEVIIKRKGMFTSNDTFSQPVQYKPVIRAGPPSLLRAAAYEKGIPLIGPGQDPPGWDTSTVAIKGRLLNHEDIEVSVSLSLATPLTYALGTPIPFVITFQGASREALDLIATPASFTVSLTENIVVGQDALKQKGKKANDSRSALAKGVCWRPPPTADSYPIEKGGDYTYCGEILVRPDLRTPFAFPGVSVNYLVTLGINVAGFVPSPTPLYDSHLSIPVRLATLPPAGPRARSYAPAPGYY